MNTIFITFLLSLSLTQAVDNGKDAKRGQFPSVIKIMSDKNASLSTCTGTLLSPTVVLTAAHCVDKKFIKNQHVSNAGDEKGLIPLVFRKKVKNVFYSPEYSSIATEFEMLNAYIRSEFFKQRPVDEQLRNIYRSKELLKKKANLDIAFIELKTPQDIEEHELSKLSCAMMGPMTQVNLVGFGRNKPDPNGEDLNSDSVLQYGVNWYAIGDLYELTPDSGSSLNNGDSGGPLFKKDDPTFVYAVASFVTSLRTGQKLNSTYASTSSAEAKKFYKMIVDDSEAPEELKKLVKPCLK